MQKLDFNAIDLAKGAVSMVVTAKVSAMVEDQIIDRTNLDPDGLPAKVSAFVIGGAISNMTRPYTDAAVEKTVAKVQVWREKRQQRKQEKTTAE